MASRAFQNGVARVVGQHQRQRRLAPSAARLGRSWYSSGGCVTCHKLDGPEKLLGPVCGMLAPARMPTSVRQAILTPDMVVEGFLD